MKTLSAHDVIQYPLSTEKSIRQIEFQNTLVFAVHAKATKQDVKMAVESLFKVPVERVNIDKSYSGIKKAYVKLHPSASASDVSAELGLL